MRAFIKPGTGRHRADPGGRADQGQEAVGQALLITAVAAGALSAGQLSRIAVNACQTLLTALG